MGKDGGAMQDYAGTPPASHGPDAKADNAHA
jgi:hypothetical protein